MSPKLLRTFSDYCFYYHLLATLDKHPDCGSSHPELSIDISETDSKYAEQILTLVAAAGALTFVRRAHGVLRTSRFLYHSLFFLSS